LSKEKILNMNNILKFSKDGKTILGVNDISITATMPAIATAYIRRTISQRRALR
jgi:hypothetical protein